ncbi:MAG: tetratricopeptide repeat protein [Roseivirga sp.]|nr:tetratricopeptide repeat protein [Roseivirga sp.]
MILVFFNHTFAQQKADSLRAILPESEGELRIDILNDLASIISTNDAAETLKLTDEALELANSLGYDEGKVQAWLVMATLASKQSQLDKTDSLTRLAIDLADRINDQKGMAMAQLTLGVLNIRRGKLDEAMQNHIDGLQAANQLGDADLRQTHTMNIGHVKRRLGQYREAEKYLLESLEIALEHGLNFRAGQVYLTLGYLKYQNQDLQSSIDFYHKALPIFREEKDQGSEAMILNNLGYAYYLQKENALALDFYNRSQVIRQRIGDRLGVSRALMNKALIAKDESRYAQAVSFANRAADIAREIKNADRMMEILALLSQIYEKQQNFREALNTQLEYAVLKDSVAKEANSRRVAELTAEFELERKENELEKNRQEISLLASEQQLLETRQFLLIALILLILVASGAIWVHQRAKMKRVLVGEKLAEERARNEALEKEKLEQQLMLKNNELKSLADQLVHQNELTNRFKSELNKQDQSDRILEIVNFLERQSEESLTWQQFRLKFDESYPEFITALIHNFPSMTPNELDISVLLKINLPNKEIAQILNISYDGVKKSIQRLYKKMNFDSPERLRGYILGA